MLPRAIATLVLSLGFLTLTNAADDGFTKLFNGTDLTGFKTVVANPKVDPATLWMVKDGELICTGKAPGYFHTDKTYSTYTLKFEWKYPRPESLKKDTDFTGNSGCLIHIQPPQQVWPKCVEVQLMYRDAGNTFGVGSKFAGTLNKDKRTAMMKPVGEWNTTEVTCSIVTDSQGKKKGKIVTKLNGEEICKGEGDLLEGPIGWQSENAEIHFRNVVIREEK